MKIGIDARLYQEQAGIGRYISNLIENLENIDSTNDYVIFVTKKGSDLYHPKNPRFKKWIADYPAYSFQEQLHFLVDLKRANLDLLHVPHFNAPIFYLKKMVVTIHDLTMHDSDKEASNLSSHRFTFKKSMYKLVTNIAVIRAKKIFVPSEIAWRELKEKIKYTKDEKLVVTYEGVDTRLLDKMPSDLRVMKTRFEEMNIRDKFFLYVGSAYPHKNLKVLIIAYKELIEEHKMKFQLVIAGKVDEFSERIAGFVHALKLDNHVIFAARYSEDNYVPDKDLAYLYKGAYAYVLPSLQEGFSITPLEAQAFGTPVILSDIPTHREIFKDTVLYFDPNSGIDLSDKMLGLANNSIVRDKLIKLGNENVKRYSWKKMTAKTLKVYADVLAKKVSKQKA